MRLRTVTSEMLTSAGDTLEGCGWGDAGLMVATSKDGERVARVDDLREQRRPRGQRMWQRPARHECRLWFFEDMLQDTQQ